MTVIILYLQSVLIFGFLGWVLENLINYKIPKFKACNPGISKLTPEKINDLGICLLPWLGCYASGGFIIQFVLLNFDRSYNPKSKFNFNIWERLALYFIFFNLAELLIGRFCKLYWCKKHGNCSMGDRCWLYNDNPNLLNDIDLKHSFYWILLGYFGEYILKRFQKQPKLLWIGIPIYGIVTALMYYKNHKEKSTS